MAVSSTSPAPRSSPCLAAGSGRVIQAPLSIVYSVSRITHGRYETASGRLHGPSPGLPAVIEALVGLGRDVRLPRHVGAAGARVHDVRASDGRGASTAGVSLYDSTFSITVWRLYSGCKGLVMWYYHLPMAETILPGRGRWSQSDSAPSTPCGEPRMRQCHTERPVRMTL